MADKVLKVARADVVSMFQALDYDTANKWNDKRLAEKLQGLPKLIDDDVEIEDEKLAKLLKDLLKAMSKGTAIELTVPDAEEEAPKKGKKEEKKPAKAEKSSKKSKKDEDDEEDEDEDEEEEDEDSDDEEESEDEDSEDDEDSDEEEEEEEKPKKKASKKEEKKPAKASKKAKDEDEEDEDEDEDSDEEDEDDEEDEKPSKKSKSSKKEEKPSKKSKKSKDEDDEEDEDEDEKVPVKKKAKKLEKKGPGVIQTIIKCLRNASEKKPTTKEKILKKLVEVFPDREEKSMKSTISSQIPSGLKTEKGLEVETDDEGGYWLPAEDE